MLIWWSLLLGYGGNGLPGIYFVIFSFYISFVAFSIQNELTEWPHSHVYHNFVVFHFTNSKKLKFCSDWCNAKKNWKFLIYTKIRFAHKKLKSYANWNKLITTNSIAMNRYKVKQPCSVFGYSKPKWTLLTKTPNSKLPIK